MKIGTTSMTQYDTLNSCRLKIVFSEEDFDEEDDPDYSDRQSCDENGTLITPGSDESDSSDGSEASIDHQVSQSSSVASIHHSKMETWKRRTLKTILPDFNATLNLADDVLLNFPKSPSAMDFFRLFVTPEFISYIVNQSNLYRIQNNLTKQSPMTEDDFSLLWGFLYYSSIIPLPSKSDYWSGTCRQSIVADATTRDRIDYLLSILHLNDNSIEKEKGEKNSTIDSFIQ